MRRLLDAKGAAAAFACLIVFGAALLTAQHEFGKPKSVIHIVTVKWKEGTTPDQIKAALDGVDKLAGGYSGIKNVWTRTVKVQGGMENVIVMEFESEEALAKYANSDAQKEWYKVYLPIREQSITHDVSN